MYHTTSNCLVNGNNSNYFTQKDLPEILKIIETKVETNETTVSRINDSFKKFLQRSDSERNSDDQSTRFCEDSELQSLQSTVEKVRKIKHEQNKDRQNSKTAECDCLSKINEKLGELTETVKVLSLQVQEHITTSASQFGELKDAITGLNKIYQAYKQDLHKEVADISQKTVSIDQQIQSVNTGLLKRLQFVSDSLKSQKAIMKEQESFNKSTITSSDNQLIDNGENRSIKQDVPINKTKIKNHKSFPAANSANEETFLKERVNEREKTLIIGDSIVQGVNPRGLKQNIQVITCRGKQAIDISTKLQTMNLNSFKQIIIYAGGNNAANGTPLQTVYEDLLGMSEKLSKKCKIYLCTVCPRTDIEVTPVNDILKQVCEQSPATLIDCYPSFVFGNGKAVDLLFHKDGIHLVQKGTSTLLKVIDKSVPILKRPSSLNKVINFKPHEKRRQYSQISDDRQHARNTPKTKRRCWNCGLTNHFSCECRYSFW